MTNISDWNWKENPFVLKIAPHLFTGYHDQVRAALKHVNDHHKIALVTGATGAGKTTMLKWLESELKTAKIYVSKPPTTPNEFVSLFTDIYRPSFFERLLKRTPTLYTLPAYISKKTKDSHFVLLIDEIHEANKDVLEWLRVLTDQMTMSLIMAGLPKIEDQLRELETLNQRITTRITLNALSKEEMREMIARRIEDVGGSGIEPFSMEALNRIYTRTGGFPREVLKLCDRLVTSAIEKGSKTIDLDLIEEHREIEVPETRSEQPVVTFTPRPPSEEQFRSLPQKQRLILEALSKRDWLTPTALTEELNFKSYASKSHAVRSINNILHRLMFEGFVQREARGKAFMYALTPKVKSLFVQS